MKSNLGGHVDLRLNFQLFETVGQSWTEWLSQSNLSVLVAIGSQSIHRNPPQGGIWQSRSYCTPYQVLCTLYMSRCPSCMLAHTYSSTTEYMQSTVLHTQVQNCINLIIIKILIILISVLIIIIIISSPVLDSKETPLASTPPTDRCQIVHFRPGSSSQQSCLPQRDDRDPGGHYAPLRSTLTARQPLTLLRHAG